MVIGKAATASPKQLAIHLALSAASSLAPSGEFNVEALTQQAQSLLPPGTELPSEFDYTAAEM